MSTKTFGRRVQTSAKPVSREAKPSRPVQSAVPVPAPAPATATAVLAPPPSARAAVSVDEELQLWKDERRKTHPFQVPWRQLYLVASISFGIASFVLPDSINDAFDYLLWALCAGSAMAWFAGRKKRAETTAAPNGKG